MRYEALWARDREGERHAFERFVDWSSSAAGATRAPRLPLRRLRAIGARPAHGRARDARARGRRAPPRRGARRPLPGRAPVAPRSTSSYSLKDDRGALRFERDAEVRGGNEAVIAFETWLETGDESLLERSSATTRRTAARPRAARMAALDPAGRSSPSRVPPDPSARRARRPVERDEAAPRSVTRCSRHRGGRPRLLLAHLLEYHRREARPRGGGSSAGRSSTRRSSSTTREALGGLELDGTSRRRSSGKSRSYTFTFPPQEHKFDAARAFDPRDARTRSASLVDDDNGIVTVCRGTDEARRAASDLLAPAGRSATRSSATRCCRFARAYARRAARRLSGADPLLERRPPRRATRSRPRRALLVARAELPLRPGTARVRQDLAAAPAWPSRSCGRESRRHHRAQPQGDPQLAPRRWSTRPTEQGLAFRGVEARRRGERDTLREPCVVTRTIGCLRRPGVPARRRHRLGLFARRTISTAAARRALRRRGGQFASPTCSPSAPPRGASSCSATRSNCRRSRRASHPEGSAPRCSSICSATTRRCPRTAGSSSRRPGGCIRTLPLHVGRVLRGSARSTPGRERADPRAASASAGSRSSTKGTAVASARRRRRSPPRSSGCSARVQRDAARAAARRAT